MGLLNQFAKYLLFKKSIIVSLKEFRTYRKATELSEQIFIWQDGVDYEKISIGQNCNAAWYLKASKNKKASYPFDWIFSSADIVLHAVKDNFKLFLDKEKIYSINKDKAGHEYYHSSLFNHKNPLESKEKYEYYKRSVDRFLNVSKEKKSTLFICFVVNEPEKRIGWANGFDKQIEMPKNQSLSTFDNLINYLDDTNPNSKFLFVNQKTEGELSLDYQFINSNLVWIDFTSKGKNTGLKYEDSIDNEIMKIVFKGLKNGK